MSRKYIISLLSFFIILVSCNEDRTMKITPIVDKFAEKNGDVPVENFYWIDNFKDNSDGIKKMFYLIEQEISPAMNNNNFAIILDDKNAVEFEDGVARVSKSRDFYFYISFSDNNRFKKLTVNKNRIAPHNFVKNNGIPYESITEDDASLVISFLYEKFNLYVLQNFLNIVAYEHDKREKKMNSYSYHLRENTTSNKTVCYIKYLDDSNKNGQSTFEIKFP